MCAEWAIQFALAAGFYSSEDREQTRQELFDDHRNIHKVTLDPQDRLARLRVACDDGAVVRLMSKRLGFWGRSLKAKTVL